MKPLTGTEIRRLRELAGFDRNRLAWITGTNADRVGDWEYDRRDPSPFEMRLLGMAVGILPVVPLLGEHRLQGGLVCALNAENYRGARQFQWCLVNGYAARPVRAPDGGRAVWLHREIMAAPVGSEVHHRNGNRLDSRRKNLEVLTPASTAPSRVASTRRSSRSTL